MPSFLIVRLADRIVALDAAITGAVVELERIVPVPRAPPHVAGLCALRSRVLTVIHGGVALGSAVVRQDAPTAVTCELDGHGYAVLVDGVEDVVDAAAVQPCPAEPGGRWTPVQRGVIEIGGEPVLVIDLLALVARGHVESTAAV